MSYLYDRSIHPVGEFSLGQAPAIPDCLPALKCVAHQHFARICKDGKSFVDAASPTTMTRAAMNPGFFRARDGFHEFDTVLDSKLRNLILNNPKYSAMLAGPSKLKGEASPADRLRVAMVDLTGAKICRPGYADCGSKLPITGGSTVKIAMLYAAHQLLFDLNQMARTGGLKTPDELKQKALNEVWSQLICPPDLNWLIEFDRSEPIVQARFSKQLNTHLTLLVDRAHSFSSVGSAIELIMRLGFEYIASVLWQSGLRHSRTQGLWIRNTFQQAHLKVQVNSRCNYKTRYSTPEGDRERITWYQDPTDDTEFSLTALSVVTFFTLLAQGRLVNKSASFVMETLLAKGCDFPLNEFTPIPGMKIRATKCGLTSDVMHVAMLRESMFSPPITYALAVLVRRNNEPEGKTMSFLHSFVKDMDRLIRENNP